MSEIVEPDCNDCLPCERQRAWLASGCPPQAARRMVASPLLYSRLRLVTPLAQSPEQGQPRCPHNRRAASPPASGHFGLAEDLRTASAAGDPEGVNWYRPLRKPSITPFVTAGDNVQPHGSSCQGDRFRPPVNGVFDICGKRSFLDSGIFFEAAIQRGGNAVRHGPLDLVPLGVKKLTLEILNDDPLPRQVLRP